MTEQLYLDKPLLVDFDTEIISCETHESGFKVELNQTAFYPEGGGQPSDMGHIEDAHVTYVFKEEDRIFHVLNKPFEVGSKVSCKLDWPRRKEMMQQHTGQHLFSAAAWKLFTAKTVGFHLTEDNLTLDLDKDLNMNEILRIEDMANEWIQSNLTITCSFPEDHVLENMPLRKRPKVAHNIRVVEVDGADCTPCGGTHPPTTALLGLIKVKRVDRYKGGCRVQFVVGVRALADYRIKNVMSNQLIASLKAQPEEIVEKVEKLQEENKDLSKSIKVLKGQLAAIEAESLVEHAVKHSDGFKIIRKVFEDRAFGDVRQMAGKLCENDNTVVLFGVKEPEASRLVYSRSKNLKELSMKDLFAPAIAKLDGRGGGSPVSAQGGGKHPEKLASVIDESMDDLLGV